jgi:colanic acid biosynthesis glycosyl transferase WcaI
MRRPDLVYVNGSPVTAGIPAALLRICGGVPFVCDAQDPWPESVTLSGMLNNSSAAAILGWACRVFYRMAARLVVPAPGLKSLLVDRGVRQAEVFRLLRRERRC